MTKGAAVLTILGLAVIAILVLRIRHHSIVRRRKKLLITPLSDFEREGLIANFPIYELLPVGLRDDLDGLINLFIESKHFEACGGLEAISLEMKLTVAAQACLLIVGRHEGTEIPYPKLQTILIYPDAYIAEKDGMNETVRLGESWDRGSVVLAWASVRRGGQITTDGHNLAMHEFAHQLDSHDGPTDGTPTLENTRAYQAWSAAFTGAWERFIKRVEKGQSTVMDEYGATNHAEFFAVAVETFFEKPLQLQRRYPKIYQEMRLYFKLDPLDWI